MRKWTALALFAALMLAVCCVASAELPDPTQHITFDNEENEGYIAMVRVDDPGDNDGATYGMTPAGEKDLEDGAVEMAPVVFRARRHENRGEPGFRRVRPDGGATKKLDLALNLGRATRDGVGIGGIAGFGVAGSRRR